MEGIAQGGVRRGVVGIELDGPAQQRACFDQAAAGRPLQGRTRAQYAIIGIEACGGFVRDPLLLELGHADGERAGDLARHAVLQLEHIRRGFIEARGPQHAPLRIDQLRADAHAIVAVTHAAFYLVSHAEHARDLAGLGERALVAGHGIPRHHGERREST